MYDYSEFITKQIEYGCKYVDSPVSKLHMDQ